MWRSDSDTRHERTGCGSTIENVCGSTSQLPAPALPIEVKAAWVELYDRYVREGADTSWDVFE